METILIDVMNLAFRSHYAFLGLEYEGRPTGALYGFLRTVRNLQKDMSRRMVFCWDHGVPGDGGKPRENWRKRIFPEYKANRVRSESRETAEKQFSLIADAIRMLGYSQVGIPGLEADDLMGPLSREIEGGVLLFTSDKDVYQLLGERVCAIFPSRGRSGFRYVYEDDVQNLYGIGPERWAEYLALGGDGSDNVKMPGMGPATALRMIADGVCLDDPLGKQPARYYDRFFHHGWGRIKAAYRVTLLPKSWKDRRIAGLVKRPPLYNVDQYWRDKRHRLRQMGAFATLCADTGMTSLLAERWEFFGFESYGKDLLLRVGY